MAGVILETGGIAHGINLEQKVFRHFRSVNHFRQEFHGRERARRLIAMDAGENGDPNRITAIGAAKSKSWERVFHPAAFKRAQRFSLHTREAGEWLQQKLDGTLSAPECRL